jgi:glucose-6-phosphate isomerase
MKITFDPSNLRADMVGNAHGLTNAEWRDQLKRAGDTVTSFRKGYSQGAYGFPDLPGDRGTTKAILDYAAQVRGTYDTVCVVGIGGSALGAWALDCGMRGPHPVQGPFSKTNPRLVILDNVDPTFIEQALASMDPKRTLVVPIAKSGSTAETVSTLLIVRAWCKNKRIAVVTSEGRGELKQLAVRENYPTFHLPDNVGGRFSVLSAVGLLPAALINIDIRKLLKGAALMTAQCWKPGADENPALQAALYQHAMLTRKSKFIQVAFPYSNHLWGTAFWFRQLWAESLGKAKNRKGEQVNVGQTPVAALGTTDQHSQVQLYMEGPNDKVFTFWAVEKFARKGAIPKVKTGFESFDYLGGQTLEKLIDAERRATGAALTENNRPNCTFTLNRVDEEHLGAFLQLMEFETAYMGELLDINAFDQEGVELGKRFTFSLMGRKGYDEYGARMKAYEKKRAGK